MSNIVLSPTIFQAIEQKPIICYHLCSRLLVTRIVWDNQRILETECLSEIDLLPRTKQLIQMAWANFISTTNPNAGVSKRHRKEFNKLASELVIANSNDAILYAGDVSISLHDLKRTHHIEEYLSLVFVERRELKPDDYFQFVDWLKQYVYQSDKIDIADRYLSKDRAYYTITEILQLLNGGARVSISTLESSKDNCNKLINDFPQLNITIKYFSEQNNKIGSTEYRTFLHSRSIVTNDFVIDLANGLDFIRRTRRGEAMVSVENTISVFRKSIDQKSI
jgi:hypothetical protein